MLRRTPEGGVMISAESGDPVASNPGHAEIDLSPQKRPSRVRYKAEIGPIAGNKQPCGCVGKDAANVASQIPLKRTINR
jgi:hypothetical protein